MIINIYITNNSKYQYKNKIYIYKLYTKFNNFS